MAADVGFVAWGSTQGAVREAIGLCRKFGMNVAALYPKFLWPLPSEELKAFATTVKQLVVVEPNRMGNLIRLIHAATALRPLQIVPEVGQQLNLMDIFLKEGFQEHFS
jgi:pyruvate/2-oxoacid:ferredoxin oxidoreductase alpha subunit